MTTALQIPTIYLIIYFDIGTVKIPVTGQLAGLHSNKFNSVKIKTQIFKKKLYIWRY